MVLDGVNDYCAVTSSVSSNIITVEALILWEAGGATSDRKIMSFNPDGIAYYGFGVQDRRLRIYARGNNGQATSITSSSFVDTGNYIVAKWEFNKTTGEAAVYTDGVKTTATNASNTDHNTTLTSSALFTDNTTTFMQCKIQYVKLINGDTSANIANWDATASSHAAGTPILTDTVGGNDATGINMPTDGSAWIDLGGGGLTVTAESQGYDVNFYDGTVGLTGEIVVISDSQVHNVTFYDATIDLTGEVLVNAEIQNYQVQFFDAQVSLSGGIEVQAQAQGYDVTFFDASVQFSGDINISAEGQAYRVTFYDASVSITELWTDKAKATTNWTDQAKTATIWTDK